MKEKFINNFKIATAWFLLIGGLLTIFWGFFGVIFLICNTRSPLYAFFFLLIPFIGSIALTSWEYLKEKK